MLDSMLNRKVKLSSLEDIKSLGVKPDDQCYCLLIVETSGELERKLLKQTDIPHDSIARNFKGEKVHFLNLDSNGVLSAISIPDKAEDKKTPSEFFMYQGAVQRLVERGWKLIDSWTEKIKFGIFVGIIFAELIVLFLIFFGVGNV